MSEDDPDKLPKMSDCAKCGKAMDFNPDDTQHQFEVECEHCQTMNLVEWVPGGVPRWVTSLRTA
jgi:DNA-directed RNA polymerase subunit RPC12/RpoP